MISLGAVIFAAGSAVSCAATTLAMVIAGRCINDGEGLILPVVTVCTVEIAPASVRGRLSMVQLFCSIGIACGVCRCTYLHVRFAPYFGPGYVVAQSSHRRHCLDDFLLGCKQ